MKPHRSSHPRRVAVLGGGMTGCVLAAELARTPGLSVDLYERADRLGGLHHSRTIDGRTYDVGAFFFDADHQVFVSFPGLIDRFIPVEVRQVSIVGGGKLDVYPLSIGGYIRNHGVAHFARATASIAWSKLADRQRSDLPSFIRYYIGDVVYRRSGLKAYIQRLYSMPDDEVDLLFVEQRMGDLRKRASLRAIARRLLKPEALGTLHAPNALARPSEGFGEAYGYIEQCLTRQGVTIHKGAAIDRLERVGAGFRLHLDGTGNNYDAVVSTAPMPVTGRLVGVPVTHRFDTISLLSLFYRYDGDASCDAVVLYNFCQDGGWKRITDFSSLYRPNAGDGFFTVEVPMGPGHVDVEAERRAFERHIAGLGVFRGSLSFQGSHLTPGAYPVFRVNDLNRIAADSARIAASGVRTCGRQGRFEYVNSKQVAASAAATASELVAELVSQRGAGRQSDDRQDVSEGVTQRHLRP